MHKRKRQVMYNSSVTKDTTGAAGFGQPVMNATGQSGFGNCSVMNN